MHLQLDESICVANMDIFINPFHTVHSLSFTLPQLLPDRPYTPNLLLFHLSLSQKKIKTNPNKTKIPQKN